MEMSRFRALIQQRQQEISVLDDSAYPGSATVELDQSKVGRLSRMDALQMQQMSLAAERRRKSERVALDAALQRIECAEYGICVECGVAINPKRLEIDLVAIWCIDCASERQ